MIENVVYNKAYAFALDIIKIYKTLKNNKEYSLADQLLRSGTSIGANIAEANGGISKDDFSAKMSIAYKESLEVKYWLDLLKDSSLLDEKQHCLLYNNADELSKILFTILKSSGRIKNNDQ